MLTLRGALDADTAPALTAAIGPEDDVRMIDALELRLLAGAGVNVLLELVGRRPTPVRASPVVRRIIDCCGLGRVLLVSPETG